jgi:hypothetical protein
MPGPEPLVPSRHGRPMSRQRAQWPGRLDALARILVFHADDHPALPQGGRNGVLSEGEWDPAARPFEAAGAVA